ncbi:MAG: DUF3040 domain-containing protein [Pseudonocardia sp.]
MLSERDRRELAGIEQGLVTTDPDLVRMFREGPRRERGEVRPTTLLVVGLVLAVVGSMLAMVPLALGGVTLVVAALYVASVQAHAGPPRFA